MAEIYIGQFGGVLQTLQGGDAVAAETQFLQVDQGLKYTGILQTGAVGVEVFQLVEGGEH